MHAGLGDDDDFAGRFVREARSRRPALAPQRRRRLRPGRRRRHPVPGDGVRPRPHPARPDPQGSPDGAGQGARAASSRCSPRSAAAHAAGLIHRDVKPENVLIADDGRVKVADFGLARAVSAETQHTATGGVLIGTVSYLSPELVVDGRADARSDVYAAGVLLYEMLTGRKPHEGESPIQVAYKHVHEDVPPPSGVVPGHPGVRRRAGRPRHRPRPRAAPGRRAGAAAPGAPGARRRSTTASRDDPELTADLDAHRARCSALARTTDIDYVTRGRCPRSSSAAARSPTRRDRHATAARRDDTSVIRRAAGRRDRPRPGSGPAARPVRTGPRPAAPVAARAGPAAASCCCSRSAPASAAGGSAPAATPPPRRDQPDRRAGRAPRSRTPGSASEVGGRGLLRDRRRPGSVVTHRPGRRRADPRDGTVTRCALAGPGALRGAAAAGQSARRRPRRRCRTPT